VAGQTERPPRRLVVDLCDRRPVWAIPSWAVEEIRGALPAQGWEVVVVEAAADGRGDGEEGREEGRGPPPEALAAVRGAEIYLGFGMNRALFAAATAAPGGRLRWVHSGAAGVRGALLPELVASAVMLTNAAGIHARPIAETVIALTLHFTRGLDRAVRQQREACWDSSFWERAEPSVHELGELTMGVLGLGGIGSETARLAAALGMRVLGWRRSARPGPAGVQVERGDDGLGRVLERSDVLVVALPDTASTRGLLGAEALAQLPAGAVFINVARGAIVDEAALLAALREGRLRGAGLDVFAREPLPPESPFWAEPSVLVTPHISATSRRFWRRSADLIVANLERYLAGEPLLNLVDKQAGY
jgi:phosphoglycerate dehydrogenase-like enzyme